MSEKELIKRCIANERQAQEILYRQHADKMYNICLTYARDEDDACDILQDGFIKMFKNLHSFGFNGSFEGWLRRIMVNTAIGFYQKKKKETENLSVYKTFVEPTIDNILDNLNAEELIRLVNQLPTKAGMVLKLFAIEGYEHKEIASLMDISEGTSKSQLNRARHLLKEAIEKQQKEKKQPRNEDVTGDNLTKW